MSKMNGTQPEGYFEYVVPPLEGLWYADGVAFDGLNVTDKSKLKDHILLRTELTDYTKYAADLNNDGLIDVSDNSRIADYILMRIDTLN